MIEKSFEAELIDALVDRVDVRGVTGSRERHKVIAKRLGVSVTTLYDLASDTGKQRVGLREFFKLLWVSDRNKAQEFFAWLSDISDGHRSV